MTTPSYWRIVKTDTGEEYEVAKALEGMGFEHFVPMELRRKTRKGRSAYVEHPLIPRRVFVMLEMSVFLMLRWRIEQAIGRTISWEKDAEGFPETIPAAQMEEFRRCHSEWLQDAQKRAANGKLNGRGMRVRAKAMAFHEALKLIQNRMEARAE